MSQNTHNFKKSLDKIKQQKIKLNSVKRNSTNNKNENDRLNMILSVIDRTYQFFECKFLPSKPSDDLKLPKWVKISKERFNEIFNIFNEAKKDILDTTVDKKNIHTK